MAGAGRAATRGGARVSHEALALSRQRGARDLGSSIFAAPSHPPAVLRNVPRLAQDEAVDQSASWAWQALAAAYGSGAVVRFLGYPLLAELAQRPEYRRISETIASEMTREWISFKSRSGEDKTRHIQAISAEMERLRVRDAFYKAAVYDGLMGRGHIFLDTGDDEPGELRTSIGNGRDKASAAKIGRKRPLVALRPVEAVWAYPTSYNSDNPLKEDWYRPQSWFVMGREVHCTRFLTLIGREVPDLLKPAYSFGGLPLSQMVKPYIDAWLRDQKSVSDLVYSFSVMVLATNFSTMLEPGRHEELFRRLEFFTNMRDNRGVMAIDKDTEDFKNVSVPLGGLSELQAQSQEHICAATGMPLIKYTGLSPAGLNASSEGEIRSWYDWVRANQERMFRDPLTTVIDLVQLSLFDEVDEDITFDFVPLWQLDEVAKAAHQKTVADIHDIYLAAGVVSAEEVRRAIAADKESPYAGLDLDAAALPEAPERETLDPDIPADPVTNRIDKEAAGEAGGALSGI